MNFVVWSNCALYGILSFMYIASAVGHDIESKSYIALTLFVQAFHRGDF